MSRTDYTSTLKRHLDEKHREILKVNEKKQPKQQRLSSSSFVPQQYPIDSSKRLNLNRKVLIHIIQDIRPISTVDQPGFRGLIHALDPKYVLPTRRSVVKMMTKSLKFLELKFYFRFV